jgi:hypothetical protein
MNAQMNKKTGDAITPHLRARSKSATEACVANLIAVLEPYPHGLRRWSVMRAMRSRAQRAGQEVSPKFEDDVERIFRRYCAGDSVRATAGEPLELFYRPKETAGEVWAINPEAAMPSSQNADRRVSESMR